MGRFILRRGVRAAVLVVAATLLVFLGDASAPGGDPGDRSLPARYLTFLGDLARLDFGLDLERGRPVSGLLAETVPRTAALAAAAATAAAPTTASASAGSSTARYQGAGAGAARSASRIATTRTGTPTATVV